MGTNPFWIGLIIVELFLSSLFHSCPEIGMNGCGSRSGGVPEEALEISLVRVGPMPTDSWRINDL